MDNEPFSNPLAPPSAAPSRPEPDRSQPLTNDDFRKLMMTPRAVMQNHSQSVPGSVRGSVRSKHRTGYKPKPEPSENVKKKKKIYEMIRKQDGDVLHELAKKYRDRAKERRSGGNPEGGWGADPLSNTAYHAVGPDNFDMDAAERRKQMIQESKYLGGDMEHTHLVKGLDYALLQKVKAEIQSKEEEDEFLKQQEEEEKEELQEKEKQKKVTSTIFDEQDRYAIKSKRAENLLKIVFNKNLPEKNELFQQGRMAYQYDLVNEFPESEIPTTVIRSKAECPNADAFNSISTNEIIINKLIQIWTQIRLGSTSKKQKRKQGSKPDEPEQKEKSRNKDSDNIYDDIGDYVPDIKPKRSHGYHSTNEKRKPYFERNDLEREEASSTRQQALELAASVVGSVASNSNLPRVKKARYQQEPESYAECYPGAPENDDAIVDSDDEGDSTKKDLTNRWETAEDDDTKSGDGRKNKKGSNPKKDEKAKLNRDYQRISALINKKKEKGEKIGMSYLSEDYNRR